MKASIYRTNIVLLVSSVLKLDYSDQGRNESVKAYNKRINNNDEILYVNIKTARKIGWLNWAYAKKESKMSICNMFTKLVKPTVPFNNIIVEV